MTYIAFLLLSVDIAVYGQLSSTVLLLYAIFVTKRGHLTVIWQYMVYFTILGIDISCKSIVYHCRSLFDSYLLKYESFNETAKRM